MPLLFDHVFDLPGDGQHTARISFGVVTTTMQDSRSLRNLKDYHSIILVLEVISQEDKMVQTRIQYDTITLYGFL
jgi:hypothetical protein